MQKRPPGLYLVAIWFFFSTFSMGIFAPISKQLQQVNMTQEPAMLLRAAAGALIVLLVLLLVGLFQRKPLAEKIIVALFALHILSMVYKIPITLKLYPALGMGFYGVMAVSILGNGLAIWYLVSRRPRPGW